MAKAYQILRRERRGEPWQFVAHGARWTPDAAEEQARLIRERGALAKLLPL